MLIRSDTGSVACYVPSTRCPAPRAIAAYRPGRMVKRNVSYDESAACNIAFA